MYCKAGGVVWYGDGGGDRKDGEKMEAAELKMVRWALGVTLKDKVRKEYIWGTAKIKRIGEAEGRETEMVPACKEKGRTLHRQKNNEN